MSDTLVRFKAISEFLVGIFDKILKEILPNVCQLCKRNNQDLVCQSCSVNWLGLTIPRCLRCAIILENFHAFKDHANKNYQSDSLAIAICGACASKPPAFVSTKVLGDYIAPQSHLVLALKFSGIMPLAKFFANHLASILSNDLRKNHGNCKSQYLLVPIPLTKSDLRKRGYNQSWEIGRRIASLCNISARNDALLKIRETPKQISLPIADRYKNLQGAFIATERVANLNIILVDDVITSGATLAAAAKALLHAGALSVHNYVSLRTPK